MTPFDTSHTNSYQRSIVTIATSCSQSFVRYWSKIAKCVYPPVFHARTGHNPVRSLCCLSVVVYDGNADDLKVHKELAVNLDRLDYL